MCGITGIYAFNKEGAKAIKLTEKATGTLQKRGPDARATFLTDNAGLGHARLSVIDISERAAQPMHDHSGRYIIVFNGEIYNFKKLRNTLEKKGVVFRSDSDTEVLLELFIKEGERCVEKLNGFFAFAVYDKKEERLFIARDRFGIKPLFIYRDSDRFIFASELKAVLAYGIPRVPDKASLIQFFRFNYLSHPSAIIKGVEKLSPGHFLKVTKNDVVQHTYYKLNVPETESVQGISYSAAKNKLRELLEQAVCDRLVADVPLGTFLSGGIDSSVITALAARHTDKLNTFSIGFKDNPFYDETKYAQLVADKYKTEHTVFSLTEEDMYEHLFEVLEAIDEPFADSSALPFYILSKKTRGTVTVALSGDGSDELFAGYYKHYAEIKAQSGGLSAAVVKALGPLWSALPQSRGSYAANKIRQLDRFAKSAKKSVKERYLDWCSVMTGPEVNSLFAEGLLDSSSSEEFERREQLIGQYLEGKPDFNKVLLSDVNFLLPGDMLTKADMMSMAVGLEVRVPFLDHRVVEYAFSLPARFKIHGKEKKKILRDAFRDLLPAELYNRPKQGFDVPMMNWFRGGLRNLIENDLLAKDFVIAQGIFDPKFTENLKAQLFSPNPGDLQARVWALIVFQSWWKKYMSD